MFANSACVDHEKLPSNGVPLLPMSMMVPSCLTAKLCLQFLNAFGGFGLAEIGRKRFGFIRFFRQRLQVRRLRSCHRIITRYPVVWILDRVRSGLFLELWVLFNFSFGFIPFGFRMHVSPFSMLSD